MDATESDIDRIIQRLFAAQQKVVEGMPIREMTVSVTPDEIRLVTLKACNLFLKQSNLIRISRDQLPIFVVADLHGQFCDLRTIFSKCGHPYRQNYLFLGDYADRGTQGVEIITLLASLKLKYPNRIFMLRGNHEDYNTSLLYGLFDECYAKYGQYGEMVWMHFMTMFNHLPVCALIDNAILAMHGLLLENQLRNLIPRPTVIPPFGPLCDLVWADPLKQAPANCLKTSCPDWSMSPRGISFNFDCKAIVKFCDKFDIDLVIRGHQICQEMFPGGYQFTPCGRMLTIFSASNYGNMDNCGAVVKIEKDLSVRFTTFKPLLAYLRGNERIERMSVSGECALREPSNHSPTSQSVNQPAMRPHGLVFALLSFLTSFLGAVFMLFPFIPFAYFCPRIWRFVADRLVGYWLTFPASLIEFVFGSRFHVTGDLIKRDGPGILLMNHRTRLDWCFLWCALYKMDPWLLTTLKISLKSALKKIPGAGWAMQCGSFMFLDRKFESDKDWIRKLINYYSEAGSSYQLLLFAEGTDRGKRAMELSNAFADSHQLARYEYLLHPRTTGFNFLLDEMRKNNYIQYVYDVTIAYGGEHIVESELELVKSGIFPEEVHFDVKRYPIEDVPLDAEESALWLQDIWRNKESVLKRFYTKNRKFEPSGERFLWPVNTHGIGYAVAFAFWIVISLFWLYCIYSYWFVKLYVLIAIGFYSVVQLKFGGTDVLSTELQQQLHSKSKSN
ncbi:hypothetical protein WR25_04729 [Diploscapter pachys]|uniref:Serine/threonine-protein phosphatase n=1 Tax=Diploscapter pachys TaxID=2018661 RepID=A0A2A2L625_9BILA|nr:hypothetical protein WR25_04729 [Diploscapter pachys]